MHSFLFLLIMISLMLTISSALLVVFVVRAPVMLLCHARKKYQSLDRPD